MDVIGTLHMRIESQNGPLTDRLRNAFATLIDEGQLTAGTALPSERDLAEGLGISRSTVRHCLRDLAENGLVRTRQGVGTVITGRIPKALSHLSGFTEDMRQRGLKPVSQVIDLEICDVPPESAFRTGLPLGTRVMRLERLRFAGDEPLSFETAIVPLTCVGADYDGQGSLYERMDARNCRPQRMLQTLEATEASEDIARLLQISPGAAVLKITQMGYGPDGTAVEDGISWYRGDRYKYVGEIKG